MRYGLIHTVEGRIYFGYKFRLKRASGTRRSSPRTRIHTCFPLPLDIEIIFPTATTTKNADSISCLKMRQLIGEGYKVATSLL